MSSLIACVTDDSGTWGHVKRVIEGQDWEKVFLIVNKDAAERFFSKDAEFIIIDSNKLIPELAKEIKEELQGKITDFEVAVNFVSGTGKEHMAMMSAVLKLGIGIRLVVLTKEGIREL